MRDVLKRFACLPIFFVFVASASAETINNGDWLGILDVQSTTCAFATSGQPHTGTFGTILPDQTLTQTGSTISLVNKGNIDFPVEATEGTVDSTGAFSIPFSYTPQSTFDANVGYVLLGCSGNVLYEFMPTASTLGLVTSGTATYTVTINSCVSDTPVFASFPCVAVFSGSITGPAIPFPTITTLRGKIVNNTLKCTLKNGTSPVAAAQITAQKKGVRASSFTDTQTKTTNAKGVATFKLRKSLSGSRVRCKYLTLFSSARKVPKTP